MSATAFVLLHLALSSQLNLKGGARGAQQRPCWSFRNNPANKLRADHGKPQVFSMHRCLALPSSINSIVSSRSTRRLAALHGIAAKDHIDTFLGVKNMIY